MESQRGGGGGGDSNLEERLKSLLCHLQTESGILDRVVYKNKNQHRRCPYFQSLIKVRRDVRLLLSAELGEVLNVLFPIIDGKKPAQRAFQSKRQKKNNPCPKHTYQERLLGVARLLSQMAEPIVQAAIQISFLLAKSFFTGFSLTVLALLARLRVLVQQRCSLSSIGITWSFFLAKHLTHNAASHPWALAVASESSTTSASLVTAVGGAMDLIGSSNAPY